MAEPIEMLFEMCTLDDTRKHALGGVHIPHMEGQFWGQQGVGSGHAQTLKVTQQWQNQYSVDADWGLLDWMHIGTTWRIQLSIPCTAVMRPYVKLLWLLVTFGCCDVTCKLVPLKTHPVIVHQQCRAWLTNQNLGDDEKRDTVIVFTKFCNCDHYYHFYYFWLSFFFKKIWTSYQLAR